MRRPPFLTGEAPQGSSRARALPAPECPAEHGTFMHITSLIGQRCETLAWFEWAKAGQRVWSAVHSLDAQGAGAGLPT